MRKILIAEDDAAVAAVFFEMLREAGYQPELVNYGAALAERIREERYDAYVLDIHLPGMNGLAAARRIRETDSDAPVVFVSGCATDATARRGAGIGRSTLIRKPVGAPELIRTLEDLLRAARPAVRRKAVLVVEDFAPARRVIANALKVAGHDVGEACDGTEALAAASRRDWDVAVVDLSVPGPHGADLIRALREKDAGLFVVAMTGECSPEEVARAYSAGAQSFIAKPFDPERLVDLLERSDGDIRELRRKAEEARSRESLPVWRLAVEDAREIAGQVAKGNHRRWVRAVTVGVLAVVAGVLAGSGLRSLAESAREAAEPRDGRAGALAAAAPVPQSPVVIIQTGEEVRR